MHSHPSLGEVSPHQPITASYNVLPVWDTTGGRAMHLGSQPSLGDWQEVILRLLAVPPSNTFLDQLFCKNFIFISHISISTRTAVDVGNLFQQIIHVMDLLNF